MRGKGNAVRGSNFFYFIRQGWKYFWSNKYISMAAVGVLAACLFVIGTFWLIYNNVDANLRNLAEYNRTVLFIDEDSTQEQIDELEQMILAIGNVESCAFVSKDEALLDFTEGYSDGLFEDVLAEGVNPLRDSFEITMKDTALYAETMYQLRRFESEGIVARIRDQKQETIDGINSMADTVYMVCYWIMGLLFVAALFIIMNTIKLARFNYRRQINIMKYVGATDWFIRWPFIFEGGIIGLLAAGLGYFFVWYGYTRVFEGLSSTVSFLQILPFQEVAGQMMAVSLAGGLLIGVLGSAISIRRFFDV